MISFTSEQRFIVTGASSGLGEAAALLLNELGASVIGIARNQERLEAMKATAKYPENVFLEQKDLTENIKGLPAYVKALKEKYGKFQGLAYCAGISQIQPLQFLDYNDLKKIFDINYFAPVLMIKGVADKRCNIGAGTSIVAIASIAAFARDKGHLSYAGSKAALSASLKCISKEVIGRGIRVNCVSPSNIKTPMNTGMEDYEESQKNLYPLGFGETKDVANMIAFLLSDKAKFISGQNYVIDSGGVL
ncbi:MAG: SDR family oxidoreductase [Alphaproteobacteria bacterium]|nr:SDR family oxidoreductase [Alphaproteobacteria bacterium]